jgi:hypothetical protein
MRKLIGCAAALVILVGAGSALAGQAATNPSGEFIDVGVAVTPPVTGTAKTPQGVGIAFDTFAGNRINGNTVGNTSSITVRFNKGFKDNAALFRACKINTKAFSTCGKSTKIGAGTAEVVTAGANGAAPTFIPATLTAYNGKPLTGKAPTVIFIGSVGGKAAAELDFTLKQQPSGPYGLAFSQIIFPSAPSSGPALGISKFNLAIPDQTVTVKKHGKKVKVHLFEAPTSCHGSWKFQFAETFSNEGPLSATTTQPCVKG